jgi:hypothetical protein
MPLSAQQAYDSALAEGEWVIGWKLERPGRRELLQQFPPRYKSVVAHHVTLRSRVAEDSALPEEQHGEVIGRADDGSGVEALIVRIDGTTDRPGGGTYHITWSLAEGREAKESNGVIAAHGWEELELPQTVKLEPACFARS